jgi:hypothetical protein
LRLQVHHADRAGAYNYDAKRQYLDVLLEFEMTVERQEDIEHAVRTALELSISDSRPTVGMDVRRVMAYQQLPEVHWKILIN